ncbi:Fungal specific transcription factor [Orbilia oligospora]|uniref:Fungal specific transcription factor n=1 Tax=Orbilia oligospora TaxID=2813651 RepID=A0A6G1MD75_ORBOL|nr:Fungal specific transcription factor [Orbilia oligospora]KAF3230671.1 Fungal specific transcription factor [Orbilia oligospora]KAF3254052.1 Fungal specific transcription factor [Orbilia oligospora]
MAEPSNPIAASAPSQSSQSVNSSSNANPGRKSPAAAPPPVSAQQSSATTSSNTNSNTNTSTRSRKDRPCDACRRRKSRCVMNEDSSVCVLCQFHKQDCTFLQSPQPRKRRLPVTSAGSDDEKHLGSNKKR